MSDEPKPEVQGWTYESLLRYLRAEINTVRETREADDRRYEQRFIDSQTAVAAALAAARIAVDAALSAAKEAVAKAEAASEKRFEGVNEFRATLSDQQRTLMPRSEAEIRMAAIEKQVEQLSSMGIERRGHQAGAQALWAWIAAAIGIGFGLFSIYRK